MTIKCRLLSSTADRKYLSPPKWQAPVPVIISQPYVVVETKVVGLPDRKNDNISICFDTVSTCDGQTRDDSNSRAMQLRRAGKNAHYSILTRKIKYAFNIQKARWHKRQKPKFPTVCPVPCVSNYKTLRTSFSEIKQSITKQLTG